MEDANANIKRYFMVLKKDVEEQMDEFKRETMELKNTFQQRAPYHADKEIKDKIGENQRAFESLETYKANTIDLRTREEELKFGLDIFGIPESTYAEVTFVEKAIVDLNDIWEIKREWDNRYGEIKDL